MIDQGPPVLVLRAFGATALPERLAGGKGGTWRAGDIVLKPSEGDDEARWRAGVLIALPDSPHFRVARPVRAADGDWLAHGWVIDWAPYWRPTAWASAVAVVDAMVWHGFDFGLARCWAHLPEWGQMLLRAAIYRLGTWDAAGWSGEPEDAYRPVVREIVGYLSE